MKTDFKSTTIKFIDSNESDNDLIMKLESERIRIIKEIALRYALNLTSLNPAAKERQEASGAAG